MSKSSSRAGLGQNQNNDLTRTSLMHLTLPSPGKLNLFLHITGRRNDGYHDLQTLFQFIDFADTLTFAPRDDEQLVLHTNHPALSNSNNLILKAGRLLQKHGNTRQGATITLNKRLPVGGGVGGGSSNAATTLLALAHLWQLPLSTSKLMALGKQLGADVPIFIHGKSAWAEGIGDKLQTVTLPKAWYLLLIPSVHVDTTLLFHDKELTRNTTPIKITDYSLEQGRNDFEPLVKKRYPIIQQAFDWLNQFSLARLTGTGATVFGRFDTKSEASRIALLAPKDFKAIVTCGCNESVLFQWGVAKR